MLRIIPEAWASTRYVVQDSAGGLLARIDVVWARQPGRLDVEGLVYRVSRSHWPDGDFVLERDGEICARAAKPSALRDRFALTWDEQRFMLRRASVLRRAFVLEADGLRSGMVRPRHPLARRATADFSPGLPTAVQVFVVWLVVALWRRDRNTTGIAATTTG